MYQVFILSICLLSGYSIRAQTSSVKPDSTFNLTGKSYIPLINLNDLGSLNTKQTDGKLLVAGTSIDLVSQNSRLFIARYLKNGSLDSSFGGGDGITYFILNSQGIDNPSTIRIQKDGRIIVSFASGIPFSGSASLTIARFNQIGELDTNFGNLGLGYVIYPVDDPFNEDKFPSSLSFDSKENIYISGNFRYEFNPNAIIFMVVKLSKDGKTNLNFGVNGVQYYDIIINSPEISTSIVVINDNQIVLGGYSGGFFSSLNSILLSIDSTGGIDYNFDPNGYKLLNTNTITNDMKLDSTGRLIISGVTGGTSTEDIFIAALFSDGRLDSTFGINGKVSYNLYGFNEAATCMTITPENKILLGGYVNKPTTLKDFLVVRLNNNGSLDSTFNQTGYYSQAVDANTSRDDELNGITIDGKRIYLSGTEIVNPFIYFRAVVLCLRDETAVGISEIPLFETFNIKYYPNPTTNEITVEIDDKLVGINYIIYDQLGRRLQNGTLNESPSIINLADLANGMYWVMLGNNRKQSFKVVKQ